MNLRNTLKNIGLPQAVFLSILIHSAFLMNFEHKLHPKIQKDLDVSFMPEILETSDPVIQKKYIPLTKHTLKKSMQQKTILPDESLLTEKEVKKNIAKMEVESKKQKNRPPEPPILLKSDKITGKPGADRVAVNKFIDLLSKHIAKFQRYPRHAQRRGWQGKVVLEIKLTGSGVLIEKKINISSGFKVLDNESLSMIDRALPLPLPLGVLKEKIITMYVPIRFTLNKSY